MKTLPSAIPALLCAAALAVAAPLHAQEESGRPLSAILDGASEPNGGDEDGSGTASFRLNQGQEQICYELSVAQVAEPTAAHIHRGGEGETGPPVVTLVAPAAGSSEGCVDVDPGLIMEIRQTPESFYVNVHNADFPGGAVRGQLTKGRG